MRKSPFYIPSEIERLTGFGKEQLRKWRQRFGFHPKESNLTGATNIIVLLMTTPNYFDARHKK